MTVRNIYWQLTGIVGDTNVGSRFNQDLSGRDVRSCSPVKH